MTEEPREDPDQIATEWEAIKQRRTAAGLDQGSPVWGLALSGGGIRSATFCLGLIKALARNGLLKRFDYVSTVSGGGYAGTALGRIFQSAAPAAQIASLLGKDDRLLWWWLRKNGRYLFPAGTKDAIFAISTLLRGMFAIYFDLLMVGLLLACVLVAPHIAVTMSLGAEEYGWVSWAPSAWWLLVAVFGPISILTCTWAYWFSAAEKDLRVFPAAAWLALPAAVFALLMWPSAAALAGTANPMCTAITAKTPLLVAASSHFACLSPAARVALFVFAASIPLAVAMAVAAGREGDVNLARNRLTRWLTLALQLLLVMVLAALLDAASWYTAAALRSSAIAILPIFGVLLIAGRALLKWLKDSQIAGGSVSLVKVANAAGWLFLLLFIFICVVFTQLVVFYGFGFNDPAPSALEPVVWMKQSFSRALWLAIPCAFYILLTGGNLQSLNKSSLHNFYRARLTRSYESVGNVDRGFKPHPLVEATSDAIKGLRRVSEVRKGDDLQMSEYQAHLNGGPIHLINVCANQTLDDRSGEFNRDRLGRNLTISSLGADMGSSREALRLAYPAGLEPSLGQWMAISGAAAAPGMGSNTTKGLAALFTLCGVRLGYWLQLASARGKDLDVSSAVKPIAKYWYLLNELTATFPKSDSPVWYVSDGGHFENTGIYALLKREAQFILAADCGADPDYTFGDLNHLVRIARIDFNAKITFLKVAKTKPPDAEQVAKQEKDAKGARTESPLWYLRGFGTLQEVASPESASYLVMAKIKYKSDKVGYLILLKPALIHTLPLDLLSYKSANPTFPQQTTADQFFDEAQWESYFRLGEVLGKDIKPSYIDNLLPNIGTTFVDHLGEEVAAEDEEDAAKKRGEAPSRVKFAGEVVKSSLGVGAVAGLLVTLWQVLDQARSDATAERQRRVDALNKAMEKSLDANGGLRLAEGGVFFLRTALNKADVQKGEVDYTVAETLLARLSERCKTESSTHPAACKEVEELYKSVFGTRADEGKLPYWGAVPKPEEPKREEVLAVATQAAKPKAGQLKPAEPGKEEPKATAPTQAGPSQDPKKNIQVAIEQATSACRRPADAKVRIYPNVYTQADLEYFDRMRKNKELNDLLGLLEVKPTENVVQTAEKNGTRPPYIWSQPTFIYHLPQDQECADAIANLFTANRHVEAVARPLPARLRPQPGTIELWIPPAKPAAK